MSAGKQIGAVAVLRGGFSDGALYYVADLVLRQLAWQRVGHGVPFLYEPTGALEPYPDRPGHTVAVWAIPGATRNGARA